MLGATPMPFSELGQREKLSIQVSREIERAIVEARFAPDARLPTELELGRSFGVSRTVIREALQQLKARGMVHSRAGSGSFVTAVSLADLERCLSQLSQRSVEERAFLELLELRLLIETEVAARVALAPSPALLEALAAELSRMKRGLAEPEAFAAADQAFHAAIIESAGHLLFSAILKPLAPLGHEYRLETYDSQATLEQVIREHTAIQRRIKARDPEGARQAMKQHLDHSRDHFLALRKPAPATPPKPAKRAKAR
jgi:DNA-binding FadR family transcriptional regulator